MIRVYVTARSFPRSDRGVFSKMILFNISTLLIVVSTSLQYSEAYRILGIFPFNGPSHNVMFDALMKGLASRGHQVDVVGHYPPKEPIPNYNHIVDLSGTVLNLRNNMTYEFGTKELAKTSLVQTLATTLGGDLCHLMDLPKFRELIRNPPQDPSYDLAIIEIFGSTCYLALGQHLKVPVVSVVTSPMWPWANDMVANPDNTAYIPHVLSDICGEMNLWQRIVNTVTLVIAKWQFKHHSAYQNDMIKKYIGPDAPSLEDAEKNVSLILVNSHYSLHGVRPFTTGVVEVAGIHITENITRLPNNLQQWLDDSTDGFVYVSFGSMLKIESFPKETLTALYSSLRKLTPIRTLIKVANKTELPPGLPSNVLTLPWIPQIAVLKHKNIRAFMTHGGLMGSMEAVYFGIPMIGVPVYADQTQNMDIYVKKNIAVIVTPEQLTEKNLDAAFEAILHDPTYMKAAKKVSVEYRDRPMTALETAIFWIEYVIRHGGTNIRSPAMDLTWWQVALLDVYGILLTATTIVVYLLYFTINKTLRYVFVGNRRVSVKKNE